MTVREVADNIAYCGLVCVFCHLADSCDGCKTETNCCGRHLAPGGCHQYNCCVSKGLSGCWECVEFPCGEDMFGEGHDARIRAFVRCAKEEGVEKLAEYVLKNQEKGIVYGHQRDYDGLDSEEAVLRLLRIGTNA